MQFDMDRLAARVERWELIFTYQGVGYPTLRPTVAMLAKLQSAIDTVSMPGIAEFASAMFAAGDRPPLEQLAPEVLVAMVKAYLEQARAVLKRALPPTPPRGRNPRTRYN